MGPVGSFFGSGGGYGSGRTPGRNAAPSVDGKREVMDMLEFLKAHQLDIMLFMSGICFILVILTLFTGTLSRKRRRILASLEAAAMFLLLADRFAYIYRGDPSVLGFWMVRISNFLVFFLPLFLTHTFTLYLVDLCRTDAQTPAVL